MSDQNSEMEEENINLLPQNSDKAMEFDYA